MPALIEKIFNLTKKVLSSLSFKDPILTQVEKLNELEKVNIEFGSNPEKWHQILRDSLTLIKGNNSEKALVLQQSIIALQYRLETVNGGLNPVKPSSRFFEKLKKVASDWKLSQPLFPEKRLTEQDLHKLYAVASHQVFLELFFQSSRIQDSLLNWTIRDQNDCEIFIQFPHLAKRLNECNLNGRMVYQGVPFLKIQKKSLKKIVTLPFEGKEIDILHEDTLVSFRGHLQLTIKEIFEVFKNKELRVGNLEFMKEGIMNWNILQLGYWDQSLRKYQQVDLNRDNWWWQLPLFEVLTLKQAKLRYGKSLNGIFWSAAASATRGLPSLSYEKTHAFMEIAIPLPHHKYAIYDFGKLAIQFPGSVWELLNMFCRNVHATVAYPDDNVYHAHRQHALHAFTLTPQEGLRLMQLIKEDILKARRSNFVYQIESENCAKWVQLKLEAILGSVPNLYRMQLLDTEPESLVFMLFKLIKKLPEKWQVPVLTALHLPLGAAKKTWIEEEGKKVSKSLSTHSFWETGEVYLPAFMHDQLLRGRLKTSCVFSVGLLSEKCRKFLVWGLKQIFDEIQMNFKIVQKIFSLVDELLFFEKIKLNLARLE